MTPEQVIAEIDEQGNAIVSYTWGDGIDNLLAVKIGSTTYYPLIDIQGTVWGYVGWIPGLGDAAKSGGKLYKGAGKAAGRVLRRGFATVAEAIIAAKAKGWDRITGGVSKNQDVFTDGRYYYTRDIDRHRGGAWKQFSDPRCRPGDRIATLDRDLNVIGK